MAADNQPIGFSIQIPKTVLEDLTKIEQKINNIATSSEKWANSFNSAMSGMATPANAVLQALTSIQSILSSINAKTGLNNISQGMSTTATQAERAASSLASAAEAMNRFKSSWTGSGRVTTAIDTLATKEALNLIKELNNVEMQRSRQLIQANRENALSAQQMANQTRIAVQMETNATNAQLAALRQQNAQIKINAAEYRNYVSAITMSESSEASRIKKIERMNTVLSELRTNESLYRNEIEVLTRKIQQLTKENENLNRARRSSPTTSDALTLAGNAKTYNERAQAIKALEAAMKNLNTTDANYQKNLKALSAAYQKLVAQQQQVMSGFRGVREAQSHLMNTSQQLSRQLALVFSVSAIKNYISKIIEVRGEFELQNTALASILQNKDKADELFSQVTELAVRSPFTIRQLTTYTKQLAAYQIQYEDLYDTTKRLADVSAGLGVPMNRLILAYGQVRAANYLRASEVRQFTEAGLNISGELAKYYSELENRMVTVGEVQEMITKRMVAFGDVEEVFRRVTSAGGIFYDMQNKQADTLRGEMLNLQDQIDLMLNSIGQSNQGVIMTAINLLKTMLNNWESIADVVTPIVTTLVSYYAVTKSIHLVTAVLPALWRAVAKQLKIVQVSMLRIVRNQKSMMSWKQILGGWATAIALVVGVAWELYAVFSETDKLQKEIQKIGTQGFFDTEVSVGNYKRLANIIASTTASYKEQEQALEELKRTYGDILPAHALEAEAIRALKGNYEEATEAIRNYMAEQTRQRQIRAIDEKYGDDFANERVKLNEKLKKFIKNYYGEEVEVVNADLNAMLELFDAEWAKQTDRSVNNALKILNKTIANYLDMDEVVVAEYSGGSALFVLSEYARKYVELSNERQEAIDALYESELGYGSLIERHIADIKGGYDKLAESAKEYIDVLAKAAEGGEFAPTKEQVDEAVLGLDKIAAKAGVTKEEVASLITSGLGRNDLLIELRKGLYDAFNEDIEKLRTDTNTDSITKAIENANKEKAALDPTVFQEYISGLVETEAAANNFTLDNLQKAFAGTGETVSSYTKRIKELAESTKNTIAQYEISPALASHWTEENYKSAKQLAAVLEYILSIISPEKSKTSGENPYVKELKEMIKYIEDAYKKYSELHKYMNAEEAIKETRRAFSNTSASDIIATMTFDESGVIESINKVFDKTAAIAGDKVMDELEKVRNDAARPYEIEIAMKTPKEEVKQYAEELNDLISQYSLVVELQTAGLPNNYISQLLPDAPLTIENLQSKLESVKPAVDAATEYQDAWNKANEDVTKKEEEELKERLKKYSEYFGKMYSEAARVRIQLAKQLAEVDTLSISEMAKQSIKENLQKEANQNLSKVLWNEFQSTGTYTQMFDDLSAVSDKGLQLMLDKLEALKSSLGNLDPSDLKEVVAAINRIKSQQILNNPFKGLISGLKESVKWLKEREKVEKSLADKNADLDFYSFAEQETATQIEAMRKEYDDALANGASAEDLADMNEELKSQESYYQTILDKIKQIREEIDELLGRQQEGTNATSTVETQMKATLQRIDVIYNAARDLASSLSTCIGLSDDTAEALNTALEIADDLYNAATSAATAVAAFASNNPVQGVASSISVVSSLASALGSLFSLGDNKLQKKIEALEDKINDLERAYEKLQDTIDKSSTLDSLGESTDAARENLKQQIKYYQQMMALEEDKKNTDEDQIKEYKEAIEDLYEELEDLAEETFNTITDDILSDVLSAADDFTDAWLEAFQETGDGMEGLEETFDEMLSTMLKRQASMLITSSFLENWKEQLQQYLNEDDLELTTEEAKKWVDSVTASLPAMNEALENYFTALEQAGVSLSSGDTLTGLTDSIQGITEDTAEIIASLLSSIRYYVAQQNVNIQQLVTALTTAQTDNPFYQELQQQTEYLNLIYSLMSSLSSRSTGNGKALKVIIC